MNRTLLFGYCSATLLVFGALAHSFGGWPAISAALSADQVDPAIVAAVGIGWTFGSVAMLVFGIIVLLSTQQTGRRETVALGPIWTIAVAYLIFGIGAFLARDFNPHFLLFVAIGAMVAGYAWSARVDTLTWATDPSGADLE